MNMDPKIIIFCLSFIFFACSNNPNQEKKNNLETTNILQNEKVPMAEFKGWKEQKQADYLNKLEDAERLKYVAEFLNDAIIFMPPNDWVKFDKNGDIVYHHSISDNSDYGIIGKWTYSNGQIDLNAAKEGKVMEEIFGAKQFTWKKVSAEAPQGISPTILGLNFDDGTLLQYAKEDQ